jgi:hypothetical protein
MALANAQIISGMSDTWPGAAHAKLSRLSHRVVAGQPVLRSLRAPLGVDPSLTRTTPPDEQLRLRVVPGPVPTPSVRRFASDADGLAPGTVVAGRYRVVSLVGQGGMGEVYRADDLTLGQPVALEFLPRNLDPHSDRFARFLAEVRTARQVSHPNVCRVYDIVQSEGRTFLAMEYVDGEDLSCSRSFQLPPKGPSEPPVPGRSCRLRTWPFQVLDLHLRRQDD